MTGRFVRMIGVEPTRREALAPETSVSTISPHPRRWKCKDIKCFLNPTIFSRIYQITTSYLCTPSQPSILILISVSA